MRNFSIGVSFEVFTKHRKEWSDNLKFITSLGDVEHIELLLEYVPQSDEELDFFKYLAKQYRLIVHSTSLDLTLLSPSEEIVQASLEKLKQAYAFSANMQAEAFTVHAGFMPKFWDERLVLQKLKNAVRRLRGSKKMPICIENMAEKWSIQIPYPCTPKHYEHVAEFSPLTLDIGHFIKSGTDPLPILRQFSQRIHNIHLHDAYKGSDHLQLGKGRLDVIAFLNVLKETNYDKFVTIEVVGKKEIKTSWNMLRKFLYED